jgi:hypothetical protein
MLENQVPDLANEMDVDLMEVQDYKFRIGEIVDVVMRKHDRVNPTTVETVLDEMLSVKYV